MVTQNMGGRMVRGGRGKKRKPGVKAPGKGSGRPPVSDPAPGRRKRAPVKEPPRRR